MKKPTLEEVKEKFKDAEIVESLHTGWTGKINIKTIRYDTIQCGFIICDCDNECGVTTLWGIEKGYAKILTYKTPKFEITKEQIWDIDNFGYSKVREWFPEAFKKELCKNYTGWVKTNESLCANWLMYFENGMQKYGFDAANNFITIETNESLCGNEYEATPQEVESALIGEWNKRGGKVGVLVDKSFNFFYGIENSMVTTDNFNFDSDGSFAVKSDNGFHICLMRDGIWATIIETITIQEAEKLLKEQGINVKIDIV